MKFADRVQETTTTTGTGTVTLAGAVTGFRTFGSAYSTGDRVPYAIVLGTEWEIGEGIYTSSGTTLSRLNVFSSSNSNSLVSFSAGSKSVWVDVPAFNVGDLGLAISLANRSVPS